MDEGQADTGDCGRDGARAQATEGNEGDWQVVATPFRPSLAYSILIQKYGTGGSYVIPAPLYISSPLSHPFATSLDY